MIFKKPSVKEMRVHAKMIYQFILIISLIVIPLFSYISYSTYTITFGTEYVIYTIVTMFPLIVAIPSMLLLIYWGEKKFYKIYKEEEDQLYKRLKRFYHVK